jgi:hypothetical protein
LAILDPIKEKLPEGGFGVSCPQGWNRLIARMSYVLTALAIYSQARRSQFFFDPLRIAYYIFPTRYDWPPFLHLPAFDTWSQSNLFDSRTQMPLYAFACLYENRKNLKSNTYRPECQRSLALGSVLESG